MKKRVSLLLAILAVLSGCSQIPAEDGPVQPGNTIQMGDTVQPGDTAQPGSSIQPDDTAQPGNTVQPSDSAQPDSITQSDDMVIIALLDTGVSTKAISGAQLLPGYNYVTKDTDTEDRMNHGTAVASVILGCESAGVEGMAQEAFLVPLVVATKQDGKMTSVSPAILAQAIRDSVDIYGADIINVSLGVHKDEEALLEAVEYAEEKGVLVVAAVGNDGLGGKPYYPAAYDTVLSVGSCDADGNESEFTQSGADILAPGEDIRLASKNGKPYGAKGTSYATGFVSAEAVKLLLEEASLIPQELREKIVRQK